MTCRINMMANGKVFDTTEVGVFAPHMKQVKALYPGEVGYVAASIKNVTDTEVGDTITDADNPARCAAARLSQGDADGVLRAVSGRKQSVYGELRDALDKLQI